jgi:tetratricopeptide (TPR) repeat protein
MAEALMRADVVRRGRKVGILGRDVPFADDVERHEYDAEAMVKFANALRLAGRYKDAADVAGIVTSDESWGFMALQVRGAAMIVLNPSQALDDLSKAIAVDAAAFPLLKRSYLQRLLGDLNAAQQDLERTLALSADDFDALHLSIELPMMTGAKEKVIARAAELADAEVRADVLQFAELCADPCWREADAGKLRTAVEQAFHQYLDSPEDLTNEALAHLIVYCVALPGLVAPLGPLNVLVGRGRLDRLVESVLPLVRHLRSQRRGIESSADAVLATIGREVSAAGGADWVVPGSGALIGFPAQASYDFPMYCRLSLIVGLERQHEMCERLLKLHAKASVRAVLFIRLNEKDRVYGECNFHAEPRDHYNFKFCDTLVTALGANLRTLVFEYKVSCLLFVDKTLQDEFDRALRRHGLPVSTALIRV